MRKSIPRNLLWILIPVVLALGYNHAANWHLHVLKNGIVVEHAHPHHAEKVPGTPYQQHQHTGLEYLVLTHISFLATLLVAAAALIALPQARILSLKIFPSPIYHEQYRGSARQLRAPPVPA